VRARLATDGPSVGDPLPLGLYLLIFDDRSLKNAEKLIFLFDAKCERVYRLKQATKMAEIDLSLLIGKQVSNAKFSIGFNCSENNLKNENDGTAWVRQRIWAQERIRHPIRDARNDFYAYL
jgi:hypothetical protein